MYKNIIVGIVAFIFLTILNVNALTCEPDEFKRLLELANKVELTVDSSYLEYDGPLCEKCREATHSITAYNLHEDLSVRIINEHNSSNYKEFKYNDTKMYTLDGFEAGNVTITIKGFVKNGCSGSTVLKKTVKLPYYNPFYDTETCGEYNKFKYCQSEFTEKEITFSLFQKDFDSYIKKNDNKSILYIVYNNFEIKNLIIVATLFVLIIGLFIFIIFKRKRSSMETHL